MLNEVLTLAELQDALERCMKAHPVDGREHRMHPDANAMSDLWAPMVLRQVPAVEVSTVSSRVLDAFHRWQGSPT